MKLLMRFARKDEIVCIPLEQRDRQELLDLIETSWERLESAELISTPPVIRGSRCILLFLLQLCGQVCWDGSDGEEEKQAIAALGSLIVV